MLRQQAKFFTQINIFFDVIILVVSIYLAFIFRNAQSGYLLNFSSFSWLLIIAIPVWLYLLNKHGLYSSIRRSTCGEIITKLISIHVIGGVICAAFVFYFQAKDYSRAIYGGFILISLILFTAERLILKYLLGYVRTRGYNTRNLLIVGIQYKSKNFLRLIEEHKDWGLSVKGFLQADVNKPLLKVYEGYPVFGYAKDVINICKSVQIDEVVFCLPKDLVIDIDDFVMELEEIGITVRVVLDFFECNRSKRSFGVLHDEVPILTFHTKCLDAHQLFLKRVLDITGALVGLTIAALIFPFIAWAIKRESPGPVFFGQDRVGENGRIFKCWKFRTMIVDAERQKNDLLVENEMKGAIFKIKNDPRIIPFGHFLRKTSLDELPQFWNVLKGEMSLVGTRPPTPAEVAQYDNWHRRRISIKPGITGLWQVSGRNTIEDFDEIVRLDLKYIDSWRFWSDIKILFKTVKVVLLRQGSC